MKKLVLMLMAAWLMPLAMLADNETPITVDQLPADARTFIATYFADAKVLLATVESEVFSKSYDVHFEGGDKLEFDKSGQWTEVSMRQGRVPAELVPEAVSQWVSAHYPEAGIRKIERDGKETEVELTNGLEITFDRKYRVIDIDD